MDFSFTRLADFLGKRLGVGQSPLDEDPRPTEMARGLLHRFGFSVHGQDFPHGNPMAAQVRLASRQRIAKGDPGEFGFEALLDHVPGNHVAL